MKGEYYKEACFNELSCWPMCATEEEVKDRIHRFVELVKGAKEAGFNAVRCHEFGLESIRLREDYTLRNFCFDDPSDRPNNEKQLLMSMIHPPYFSNNSDDERKYVEGKYQVALQGDNRTTEYQDAYGLAAAFLKGSIGLNLCSSDFWINTKEYSIRVKKDGDPNYKLYEVLSFSSPEDFNGEHFVKWQVENLPRDFPESTIKNKKCNLTSTHHGNNILEKFAKKSVLPLPYIVGVVKSLEYSSYCKSFVKDIHVGTWTIDVVLTWTEEGFGMVLKTTARNEVELRQMAKDLEKRFGNKKH